MEIWTIKRAKVTFFLLFDCFICGLILDVLKKGKAFYKNGEKRTEERKKERKKERTNEKERIFFFVLCV